MWFRKGGHHPAGAAGRGGEAAGVWVVEGVGYFCGWLGLDEDCGRLGHRVAKARGREQLGWRGQRCRCVGG